MTSRITVSDMAPLMEEFAKIGRRGRAYLNTERYREDCETADVPGLVRRVCRLNVNALYRE